MYNNILLTRLSLDHTGNSLRQAVYMSGSSAFIHRWMNVILLPLSQWVIIIILIGLDILMYLGNSQNTEARWSGGMFSLNIQRLLKKLNIYKILWNESECATIFLQTVCKCLIAPKSFFKVNKNKNICVFLLILLIFLKPKQFFLLLLFS